MKINKITLSLITSLFIFSCGSNKSQISIFIYDKNDTFISSLSNQIVENLSLEYKINLFDSKKSQNLQNQQIVDTLHNKKVNTLIINMVDRLSSGSIIQKASQTNTPIIFFNREPILSDIKDSENVYYVGTNPKQEGENQAKMAINLLGDPNNLNSQIDKNHDNKLQCVFIRGEQSHQDTELRTYSCINYLIKNGYQIDILDMKYADWDKAKGKEIMKEFYLTFGNNIEFVFSNNDDMALGAIEYLLQENIFNAKLKALNQPFPIVGVDGTNQGLKAIKNGYLYGTIINDAKKQALAIDQLVDLINGNINKSELSFELTNNTHIYVSGSIVTSENIDSFYSLN